MVWNFSSSRVTIMSRSKCSKLAQHQTLELQVQRSSLTPALTNSKQLKKLKTTSRKNKKNCRPIPWMTRNNFLSKCCKRRLMFNSSQLISHQNRNKKKRRNQNFKEALREVGSKGNPQLRLKLYSNMNQPGTITWMVLI